MNPATQMRQIVGSAASLVEYATRSGLIQKPVIVEQKVKRGMPYEERLRRQREREKARRAALQALGLTVNGKTRRRKTWPELRGLDRETYLERYHQIQRERKSNNAQKLHQTEPWN